MTQARDIMDDALATAMHAMRTVIATSLGSTPGALAFSRDMLLNIPLVADWKAITHAREQRVNENLCRENAKRRSYDYEQGQKVLKLVHKPTTSQSCHGVIDTSWACFTHLLQKFTLSFQSLPPPNLML